MTTYSGAITYQEGSVGRAKHVADIKSRQEARGGQKVYSTTSSGGMIQTGGPTQQEIEANLTKAYGAYSNTDYLSKQQKEAIETKQAEIKKEYDDYLENTNKEITKLIKTPTGNIEEDIGTYNRILDIREKQVNTIIDKINSGQKLNPKEQSLINQMGELGIFQGLPTKTEIQNYQDSFDQKPKEITFEFERDNKGNIVLKNGENYTKDQRLQALGIAYELNQKEKQERYDAIKPLMDKYGLKDYEADAVLRGESPIFAGYKESEKLFQNRMKTDLQQATAISHRGQFEKGKQIEQLGRYAGTSLATGATGTAIYFLDDMTPVRITPDGSLAYHHPMTTFIGDIVKMGSDPAGTISAIGQQYTSDPVGTTFSTIGQLYVYKHTYGKVIGHGMEGFKQAGHIAKVKTGKYATATANALRTTKAYKNTITKLNAIKDTAYKNKLYLKGEIGKPIAQIKVAGQAVKAYSSHKIANAQIRMNQINAQAMAKISAEISKIKASKVWQQMTSYERYQINRIQQMATNAKLNIKYQKFKLNKLKKTIKTKYQNYKYKRIVQKQDARIRRQQYIEDIKTKLKPYKQRYLERIELLKEKARVKKLNLDYKLEPKKYKLKRIKQKFIDFKHKTQGKIMTKELLTREKIKWKLEALQKKINKLEMRKYELKSDIRRNIDNINKGAERTALDIHQTANYYKIHKINTKIAKLKKTQNRLWDSTNTFREKIRLAKLKAQYHADPLKYKFEKVIDRAKYKAKKGYYPTEHNIIKKIYKGKKWWSKSKLNPAKQWRSIKAEYWKRAKLGKMARQQQKMYKKLKIEGKKGQTAKYKRMIENLEQARHRKAMYKDARQKLIEREARITKQEMHKARLEKMPESYKEMYREIMQSQQQTKIKPRPPKIQHKGPQKYIIKERIRPDGTVILEKVRIATKVKAKPKVKTKLKTGTKWRAKDRATYAYVPKASQQEIEAYKMNISQAIAQDFKHAEAQKMKQVEAQAQAYPQAQAQSITQAQTITDTTVPIQTQQEQQVYAYAQPYPTKTLTKEKITPTLIKPEERQELIKAYLLKAIYGKQHIPIAHYETQWEAHEEGKKYIDNTRLRRFKVEKTKTTKKNIKKGKAYGAEHKFFRMPKGITQERKRNWNDTKGERKGHFNWTKILSKA